METAHLLPMILRRFHLAKLLKNDDFEAIKRDIKRYKLGWGLDEKVNDNNIEKILNELGAYRDKVVLWGDGSVYREMMNSDDLADACVYLLMNKDYWLASATAVLGKGYVAYYIQKIYVNETGHTVFGSVKLYDSMERVWTEEANVLPVVTLNTNIQTTGQDSNGVWQLDV